MPLYLKKDTDQSAHHVARALPHHHSKLARFLGTLTHIRKNGSIQLERERKNRREVKGDYPIGRGRPTTAPALHVVTIEATRLEEQPVVILLPDGRPSEQGRQDLPGLDRRSVGVAGEGPRHVGGRWQWRMSMRW